MTDAVDMTKGVYRRVYSGFLRGRKINTVSMEAEATFWRLCMLADDFGNFCADAMLLRSDAFPLRDTSAADVLRWMGELERIGLIIRYEVENEKYAHIVNFEDYQPEGYDRNRNRRRRIQRFPKLENEGLRKSTKAYEEKRSVTKENEGLRKKTNAYEDLRPYTDTDTETETHTETRERRKAACGCSRAEAEAIYALYPRKVGKRAAIKSIQRAVQRLTKSGHERPLEHITERVRKFAASPKGQPPAMGQEDYRKHPATWFNQDCFDDEDAAWGLNSPASGVVSTKVIMGVAKGA